MEHIKEALTKANASLDDKPGKVRVEPLQNSTVTKLVRETSDVEAPQPAWAPRQVQLDSRLLERNRIVSYAGTDPNHVAVNLLRTRVRKITSDNRWKHIAITSPTPGCGKTLVGLNLAFSLSRSPDCRVVLVDLDLKKPAVARTLGVEPIGSIGRFLQGHVEAKDCFVEVNANLVVGLNSDHIAESSELIQSRRMGELFSFINTSLSPDIVLFDLPPMGAGDDVLAFLPRIDATLLVVAAGTSTIAEVDECEQQISEMEKLLGVVLNKSDDQSKDYYY